MLTVVILGVLVGAVLGLTGAGGGILATPALIASLGWSVPQAAPVALLAVASGAALGAIEGLFQHLVRYRAAALMAIVGLPFSALGMITAHHLPLRLLTAIFALVMLLVAYRNARQGRSGQGHAGAVRGCVCRLDPRSGRLHWNGVTVLAISAAGALSGFLTGLLGVGGGFVIVPALRRLTNLGMHSIVATSLLVIALVGSGSVLTFMLSGQHFPLRQAGGFVLAAMAGMMVGRILIHRLSARQVQLGFAVFVTLVALGMLLKAWVS